MASEVTKIVGERGREERGEGRHEMRRGRRATRCRGPELEREATQLTPSCWTRMGYEAEVSAHADGTRSTFAPWCRRGDDSHRPKGEVRQALQHILNRMLNRGGGSTYHLQLEVNDFWEAARIRAPGGWRAGWPRTRSAPTARSSPSTSMPKSAESCM